MVKGTHRGSGVYVWRTRKPNARLRIPFLSRHFAYVGETVSLYHRTQQHLYGLSRFEGGAAKPWSDLEPELALWIPLPKWKPLLRFVETIVILLTWPVYNHKKNLWNPRRIPLPQQYVQRAARDANRWSFNFRPAHLFILMVIVLIVLKIGGVW